MGTRHNNIYYKNNKKYFIQLQNLIKENPNCYFNLLNKNKKYEQLKNWINSQVPQLKTEYYKITTKCYWILNNLIDFPKCNTCGKNITRNCGLRGYSTGKSTTIHCANNGKCANNDKDKLKQFEEHCLKKFGVTTPFYNSDFIDKCQQTCIKKYGKKHHMHSTKIKNKIKNTCIKKYGVENVFAANTVKRKIQKTNIKRYGVACVTQNHNIFKKQRQKYKYNNINFDSAWELAYYIWLSDNNITFEYHPNITFTYKTSDGKQHMYFPDFLINNKIYEIKGDYFFNKNNDPIKFNKYPWFEKYQCIKDNNVQILLFKDIKQQYEYCCNKFNSIIWYKQFKTLS